jgi:enoyl-CoA hydratase/carnithine racemase
MTLPGLQALTLELAPPLAVLTLDRPARLNALSPALIDELMAAGAALAARDDCQAILLRGAGRGFCAGFDLDAFGAAGAPPPDAADADQGWRLIDAWAALPQVTLAAVHGPCLGGGLLLAAACDLRIAADDAQFGLPEIELGLPLAWGGVPRLLAQLGPALTAELVLDARRFGSAEALAWRWLNRVVPAANLDDEARAWAGRLAARPARPLRAAKRRLAGLLAAADLPCGRDADAADLLAAPADPEADAARLAILQRQRRR